MFKLAIFVAIVAVVYGAETPIKTRQVVLSPTIQPLAGINPYYRQQPIHYNNVEASARILSQQQDAAPDGSGYAYSYETENGIAAQEQGQWRQLSAEEGAHSVIGSYRFPLQDGRVQIVEYTADENGFKPVIKYQ
ncbi:cuticle protein CP14.6-like [Coccinella septempunctata]|uniref:cuticle protein CP14.6-like n=1 Tax=Coccinella septempunctata TaxID=41139 RepID=UPI001D06D03E|nr:cuticle protein CP14.6-like [Coccinella septempunctata]